MVKAGSLNRFLFIPCCAYLVAANGQQSFYPIARLFNVLNHKDERTPHSIVGHDLFHKRTSFSYQS